MRVTLFSTNDRVGGAARCCLRIREALHAAGADSVLLSLRRSMSRPGLECAGEQLPREAVLAHEEERALLREQWRALATPECVSMVSAPGPGLDVSGLDAVRWANVLNLHWTAWFLGPQEIAALGGLGKPLVWTLHDEEAFTGGCHYASDCQGFLSSCEDCPQVAPAARAAVAQAFRAKQQAFAALPVTIVTTSRWLAERARSSALLGHKRIEVIPSGFDTDVFQPCASRRAAKRALGFSPHERIVLMPSACLGDVRKGARSADDFLARLAAAPALAQAVREHSVRVVFFGASDRDMAQLPLRAGCLGEIHEEAALARVYAAADCVVTLSGHDNLPNTVAEAMLCATPVAAFAVGGVPEMIEHGNQGLLAQPGDLESLAGLAAALLADPERLEAMGARARTTAVERYSLAVAARQYLALFQELLSEQQAPGRAAPAQISREFPPFAGQRLKAEAALARLVRDGIQRAFALRDAGQHGPALALLDSLLLAAPGHMELMLVRGGLLVAAGRAAQAAEWLAGLYADFPEDRVGLSLCDALRLAGDTQGALAVVEALARRNPLAPGVAKKRGQALEAVGQARQAVRLYLQEYRRHRDAHALTLARKALAPRAVAAGGSGPVAQGNEIDALPSTYSLETVLGCNLSCVECAVGSGLVQRKHGTLAFESYLRIADRIRPHCAMLLLHIWGEPLLNKDIVRMVRHASAFTRTNISTNAHLLDRTLALDLLRAGLTQATVSIDGATQDVYARYRQGGTLDRALAGLGHLVEARARLGSPVEIIPQFIVFRHNEHQMEAFRDLCLGLGLAPVFKSPYLRPGSALANGTDPRHIRPRAAADPERRQDMARHCANTSDVMTVLLDGTVCACCYDHNAATAFGNLLEQDLREIWHSEAHATFRRLVQTGHAPRFCLDNCLNS